MKLATALTGRLLAAGRMMKGGIRRDVLAWWIIVTLGCCLVSLRTSTQGLSTSFSFPDMNTATAAASNSTSQSAPEDSSSPQKKHAATPIIDVISVGSQLRTDYQDAQSQTMGSHPAVRTLFLMTEHNDTDTACQSLTVNDIGRISRFCRNPVRGSLHHKHKHYNELFNVLKNSYAGERWLAKKANPTGWLCAQTRPCEGLHAVLQTYKSNDNNGNDLLPLPDYLLVIDDDTYVNVEALSQQLLTIYPSQEAWSVAGCLIKSPYHNMSMPFGGFGTLWTRQALINFQRKIYCSSSQKENLVQDGFTRAVCWRLKQDFVGERRYFVEGMSVEQLMHAYVTQQPYFNYRQWNNIGFCLHSDWVWGYFVNYYFVSQHAQQEQPGHGSSQPRQAMDMRPEDRFRGYMDNSVSYAGKVQDGQCLHKHNENCHVDSHLCHYITPDRMHELHQEQVGSWKSLNRVDSSWTIT